MLNSPHYAKLIDLVNSRPELNIVLITSSPKLKREYNMELLKKAERKVVFKPPVYTLDEFARYIFDNKSMDGYRFISKDQMEIILYELLKARNRKKPFVSIGKYVNKMTFVRSVARSVSEMREMADGDSDIYERLSTQDVDVKQREFVEIVRLYEDALRENMLIDIEGVYRWLIDEIELSGEKVLSDYDAIWFEYLFDLNPLQKRLITAISQAVQHDFCLPTISSFAASELEKDGLEKAYPDDITAYDLVDLENGEVSFLSEMKAMMTKDNLERSCVKRDVTWPDGSFEVMEFRSQFQEMREVARIVKKLIVDEGFSPLDICIVLPSDSKIKMSIEGFLQEFDVPFYRENRVRMASVPTANSFTELVFTVTGKYERFDILKLYSNPIIGSGPSGSSYIRRRLKVKKPNFSMDDWVKRAQTVEDRAFCKFVDLVYDCWTEFRSYRVSSLSDWVERISSLADVFDVKRKILSIKEERERADIWKWWAEFENVLDVLYEASTLLNYEMMWSLDDFMTVFCSMALRVSVKDEIVHAAGVNLRSVKDMWGQTFKVTILCAANKGGFQNPEAESWMLSEADRTSLLRDGGFVQGSVVKAFAERAAIVGAVCSASHRFCISYSTTSGSGKVMERAPFVDELLELASDICSCNDLDVEPNALVRKSESYDVYAEREACSLDELGLMVARNSALAVMNGEGVEDFTAKSKFEMASDMDERYGLCAVFVDDSREVLNRYGKVYGQKFTEFDGMIADDEILSSIKGRFDDDFVWSASMIKDYIDCPFKFLARRVLGIRERDRIDEDPLARDVGSSCHRVLKEVFSHGKAAETGLENENEYLALLDQGFSKVFGGFDVSGIDMSKTVWDLKRQKLLKQLKGVVLSELGFSLDVGNIWRPAYFEWSFGEDFDDQNDPASTVEPLVLNYRGNKMKFKGIVDRIDVADEGFMAIYDYKLGSTPAPKDIKEKSDIQMFLYILAVGKLLAGDVSKVAGGSYYSIKNAKVESGMWQKDWADRLRAKAKRSGKMVGEEWMSIEESISEFIYGKICNIRRGHFEIRPIRPCEDQHCELKGVCGFDPLRMKRDGGSEGELQ